MTRFLEYYFQNKETKILSAPQFNHKQCGLLVPITIRKIRMKMDKRCKARREQCKQNRIQSEDYKKDSIKQF